MIKKILTTILILGGSCAFSQENTLIDQLQYGASIKAKIELSKNAKDEPLFNFRISSNVGAAGKWLSDNVYPSVNCEFQLYNGGLGSRSKKNPLNRYSTFDAVIAFTLTAGDLDKSYHTETLSLSRNNPLRYFADFAVPSLQNPYNYSISLGTNFVFTTDGARSFQRLGFLNLNCSGVQLSYYNDGTPFQHILLGDGKDRYYTGGGVLSYNNGYGNISELRSYSLEVSYHKFTGFNLSSFELANSINASNVDYKEEYQKEFNKSLWKFNFLSNDENHGYGLAAAFYNSTRFDGQHLIHWLINNSFHIVPYDFSYALEPSYYLKSSTFKNL
jgi:hypothetical protein